MRRINLISALIAFLIAAMTFAAPAQAQATRTWVSGVGDDANPCSRTAPCKTFAGAISKTAVAGEINCLDPGGFGALTITKAISIICQAGTAGVLVSGTNGITVSAGTTDFVYLNGLDFEGLNSSQSGISIIQVGLLRIENSIIRGFTTGINVAPSSGGATVEVIDSVVSDNTGTGILGFPTGSASIRMLLNHTRVTANGGDGVMANGTSTTGNIKYSLRDSESSDNTGVGFVAYSAGAVSQQIIDSSSAFNNKNSGIAANGSGATIRFTRSNVSGNGTGVLQVSAGAVLSYGTNSVNGNSTDGTFGTTPQE